MAASSIGRRLNRSSAHRSEGSRHKKPAFTQRQLEYLRSQRLAHLATADEKGAPHVVPLRFRVATHGAAIEFGGRGRRHHRPRHQRHRCGGAGVEYDPGQRGRLPLIRSRQTAGWESSSSTLAAWPSAFTPYQASAIRPSSSTRNVERMTPVTGFPYIIFSP